jgi:hypothetical protein
MVTEFTDLALFTLIGGTAFHFRSTPLPFLLYANEIRFRG